MSLPFYNLRKTPCLTSVPLRKLSVRYCKTLNDFADFIETLTEKDNYPCQVYDDADGKKYFTCMRRFWEQPSVRYLRDGEFYYSVDDLIIILLANGFLSLDFETYEITIFAPVADYPIAYGDEIDLKFVIDKKKYAKLRHYGIFLRKLFKNIF